MQAGDAKLVYKFHQSSYTSHTTAMLTMFMCAFCHTCVENLLKGSAYASVFCFSNIRTLYMFEQWSCWVPVFLEDIFRIASFNLLCIGFRLLAIAPPHMIYLLSDHS